MTTAENEIGVNTNLQKQDLSNLDISNLTPLSPEVISRQATINIGTIGHVAHGKSTVVKAISGVQTVRFKNELERNITIKLERISYEQLLKISQSAKLLREYEARENLRLKQLQYERKFNCSPSSSLYTTHTYHQHHHYNPQQQVDTFLSAVERGNSTSPSSGYESFDNASSYSGDEFGSSHKSRIFRKKLSHTKQIFINAQKQLDAAQTPQKGEAAAASFKRRASTAAADCGDDSQNAQKAKRRRHNPNSEYVVERIESLESVNGRPVFYVKWLNYPENQNTWESTHNLFECEALEQFVDKQYEFYDLAISTITAELEAEIERESLSFETSKLNLEELDSYEPLLLKADLILLAQFREANSRNQREPALIRKRVIEAMLIKPFYYLRKKQLNDLQKWQERMNEVEYQAPVSVENNVDLEVLDMSFQYIKESFPGEGVQISDQPPFGCKCVDACAPMSKCCARMADSYFAYEKNGRLRIRPGEAIYECNRTCACNEDCVNRVIQRGRNNALCLFKTSTGCGWGVRTERIMRKGEYVCEYVGEIIKTEEANERGKQYDAIGRTYLFDLDYNTAAESVYTIDAAMHGNISHFINHSCDPNLAVFPFWINNLDVNMPRLAFFTLRPIKAGEELTFDYIRTDSDGEDYNNLSKAEKVTCRCGAEKCRKVLF